MRLVRAIPLCSLLLAPIVGCSGDNKRQPAADPGHLEAPKSTLAPSPDSAQPAAVARDQAPNSRQPGRKLPDPLRGKVQETVDSGGYTYILLASEQGDVWAAARTFAVAVGDEVELAGLMPMYEFRSPTLGRTFIEIQFVGRATVIGGSTTPEPGRPDQEPVAGGLPPGHPPVGDAATPPKATQSTPSEAGEIEPLSGGLTVAELFDKKADLQGKLVKFRGRVVKANRGILGRNWLHVQDGTGEPGSNDITVTSATGFASTGSLVVIEGTLGLEKDFGAGYTYDVIVEDATVIVESPNQGVAQPDADPGSPEEG